MPRGIARKLVLYLTSIIIIVEGIFAYTDIQAQKRQLLNEMTLSAELVSQTMVATTWNAMLEDRREYAYQMMNNVARQQTIDRFGPEGWELHYNVFGRNGVMGEMEPLKDKPGHELCIVVQGVAPTREMAEETELLTPEARLLPTRAGHYRLDRQDDILTEEQVVLAVAHLDGHFPVAGHRGGGRGLHDAVRCELRALLRRLEAAFAECSVEQRRSARLLPGRDRDGGADLDLPHRARRLPGLPGIAAPHRLPRRVDRHHHRLRPVSYTHLTLPTSDLV